MLRSNLQLTGNVILDKLFEEGILFVGQKIVKPDTTADKYLFHTGNGFNPSEQLNVFTVIGEQVRTRFREQAPSIHANTLRLLDLPDSIAEMVKEGALSAGHARTLLPLEDPEEMEMAANRIIARSLSVRDAEALVKRLLSMADETDQVEIDSEKGLEKLTRIHMKELENRARATLSRRVRITNSDKKKTIELAFEDNEDLEILLKKLCGNDIIE